MPTPKLSVAKHRRIHELAAEGLGRNQISRKLRVSLGTVSNFIRKPLPAPDPTEGIPERVPLRDESDFDLRGDNRVLILSDIHFPEQEKRAIDAAISYGRANDANLVILNGDIFDCHEISRFDKDPRAKRYVEELKIGRPFFPYLRSQFPKARIVYKEGNHEERLEKYIVPRAPALLELECLSWPSLLGLRDSGVDWLGDKRKIGLGKLSVFHGHELGGGGECVHPAKRLFDKAGESSLAGHHHRKDEYHKRTASGKEIATWVTGCLCHTRPYWLKYNNWTNGFAFVRTYKDGSFEPVENRRVLL